MMLGHFQVYTNGSGGCIKQHRAVLIEAAQSDPAFVQRQLTTAFDVLRCLNGRR